MKFGYLRKDDDGHDYLVPEEMIDEFDVAMEIIEGANLDDWHVHDDFNERFGHLMYGRSTRDLKVLMEEA